VRLSFALIFGFLLGCEKPQLKSNTKLFPIDSLLENQIAILSERNVDFQKASMIGGESRATSISSNDIQWEEELMGFREIALINRPIYRDAYSVSETRDPKSNLMIRTWTAVSAAPVKRLTVYYLKELNKVKRIESRIEESNFIYSTRKDLTLEFDIIGSNSRLQNYSLGVKQKYVLTKPDSFRINALIRLR